MKVKLKTKEQLIKIGWKENLKSIYARLSIDSIKSKPHWDKRKNRLGTLTSSQVDNCLGQKGEVVDLKISNDGSLQFLEIKVTDCGTTYYLAIPIECVIGFDKKKWDEMHSIWQFRINHKSWKYSPFKKIFTCSYQDIASMKKAIRYVENKTKKLKIKNNK
ncbi:MAG: hypothetical protein ACTSRG_12975 [Candidatus Helarchaeota archaeon]